MATFGVENKDGGIALFQTAEKTYQVRARVKVRVRVRVGVRVGVRVRHRVRPHGASRSSRPRRRRTR